MAEAIIPSSRTGDAWLDRPIAPSWQRLAGLVAHWEMLSYGSLILLGFIMRIWDVGSRALHHDESLHAYYAWKLYAGQGYTYDPLMHGPLKFEVTSFFYLLFGDSEFSARLFPVIMGTAMIALPYLVRHHLTSPGALAASLLIAFSPTLLYFSRFIRDDVPLAFFTFLLFICVVRYIESHQNRYLYTGTVVMALSMASMEASYLMFFIFGTFIIFAALREFLESGDGPVVRAFKATSLDAWLTAISIFVVITVVLYSTFFTNPYGIWDPRYSLMSADRKDILGGLTYWIAQHSVQRGGQPWYYYLLVIPLYEQIAVLFGIAGAVGAIFNRSLFKTFLVWWAASSFLLFSWAGEKMPWLSLHITLPLLILAGMFIGRVLTYRRGWKLVALGSAFSALFALQVHSAFALSYQDGANPTEMLIYVQTSQDVPNVVHEIGLLSRRYAGGTKLQIGLDDNDVGGWPFIWYLRDYPNVTETSTFSGPTCGTRYCPVLLMLGPEFDQYGAQLAKRYVVQQYRWNWWFPEDYKQWFPDHVGTIPLALSGGGKLDSAPVGTPADWSHLWNWLIYRKPFGTRGARMLYFLVRRDLVPGAKYFSTQPPANSGVAPVVITPFHLLPSSLIAALGSPSVLSGPRGVAADAHGNVYVADSAGHRVVEFGSNGSLLRSWGSAGTGAGQFNQLDSPEGIAIGRDGNVYVTDTWNERVEVFSPTGTFLRQWGGGPIGSGIGEFYGPRSIAIGPNGHVYVADTGNERVQVFTSQGKFVTAWGTKGVGLGQFTEPSSVAIGPSGKVYVSDFWNQRIQTFSPSGAYIRSWSVTDWPPGSYDEPYLAVDRHTGTVFATEPQQARVVAWTSTGKALGAVAQGELTLPVGIAVRPNGQIAISDTTGQRVDVFALQKSVSATKKPRK